MRRLVRRVAVSYTHLDVYKRQEQGNAVAEYKLGTMYYGGHGVEQDNQQAVTWFGLAARQGLPQAVQALTIMRHNGHCCTPPTRLSALPMPSTAALTP